MPCILMYNRLGKLAKESDRTTISYLKSNSEIPVGTIALLAHLYIFCHTTVTS